MVQYKMGVVILIISILDILNNGNFSGTIASDIDSAAFWAIPGTGNGDSDHPCYWSK